MLWTGWGSASAKKKKKKKKKKKINACYANFIVLDLKVLYKFFFSFILL